MKEDAENKVSLQEESSTKERQKRKGEKKNLWPLKVTIITLVLSAFFSFSTEILTNKSNLIVAFLICVLLILISIIFDGIGVAVTNCDIKPLTSMASRRVPGSKRAIRLVQNSEKVSSICCDVIGDICGVISGACSAAIVIQIIALSGSTHQLIISIAMSATIAALTVGGKAIGKTIAIRNSKELVMLTARILGLFSREGRKEKKHASEKKKSSR
ncbi:MAG TPA: Mg2+ and Co2+ transporter CorB [Clostridiales bacterium]|nr:Mg2+ and Co2+ transporter CorB [Clostridiales bacterium]